MRLPVVVTLPLLVLAGCGDRTALLVSDPAPDAATPLPADCAAGGVVTIASRPAETWFGDSMAVDATNVYWLEHGDLTSGPGRVMRAPKCGGAAVEIAPTLNYVDQLAIDATSVYWTNSSTNSSPGGEMGEIMSAPLSGGGASVLASGLTVPWGIAVDATGVYWTDDSSLLRVATTGGASIMLASGPSPWMNVAVNDALVVWTNQPADGWSITSMGKSGSGVVTSVAESATGLVGALAIDESSAYFASFGPGYGASGTVSSAALTGGGTAQMLAEGYPTSIALDDANVYFTDYPNMTGEGAVRRVSKAGGASTTLASGLDEAPSAVAVDDTRVYWLGATTVMSAPK
jgi:hypothetical protein